MFDRMAILLLASGLSTRFGPDDKLLASLGGKPVISYAANALASHPVGWRVAVVGAKQAERRRIVEARGFHVALNLAPDEGQGRSLAIGLKHVTGDQGARKLFTKLDQTRTVKTNARNLADIDSIADLQQAEQKLNG